MGAAVCAPCGGVDLYKTLSWLRLLSHFTPLHFDSTVSQVSAANLSETTAINRNMTSPSLLIVLVGIAVLIVESHSVFLPKRANGYMMRDSIVDPKKRPFCNAFTGCGRKRSNLPPLVEDSDTQETIGSLLELSAEPAVEDLSRQIMSEAKLWEAIQEANMELLRRKQESAELPRNDPEPSHRGAIASCPMPPCYI